MNSLLAMLISASFPVLGFWLTSKARDLLNNKETSFINSLLFTLTATAATFVWLFILLMLVLAIASLPATVCQ